MPVPARSKRVRPYALTGGRTRSRQVPLYRAALRAGASEEEISTFLQYPHGAPKAIVRHSSGHVKHIHVRFLCAEYETQCSD